MPNEIKLKPHRKPTGHVGTLIIPAAGGTPRFDRIQFPETKEAIEDVILERTLDALQRGQGALPWPAVPVRNSENDFDFTIPGKVREYLDLMEVAPLKGTRGFASATLDHNHGALADSVWTALTQKAQRYGLPRAYAVHLLIYSTDVAFQLFPEVLKIISYHLSIADRGFKTIYYSVPEDSDSAYTYCLHPRSPQEFLGYDVRAARSRRSLIADPTRMTIVGKGAVRVPLGGRRRPG